MELTRYKCDGCGVAKEDSNHWWKLIVNEFGYRQVRWEEKMIVSDGDTLQHLCGQECAIKKLSEYMGQGSQPQWTVDGMMGDDKDEQR